MNDEENLILENEIIEMAKECVLYMNSELI